MTTSVRLTAVTPQTLTAVSGGMAVGLPVLVRPRRISDAPRRQTTDDGAIERLQQVPGGTSPEVGAVLRAAQRADAGDLSGARCTLAALLVGGADTPAARTVRIVARALYNKFAVRPMVPGDSQYPKAFGRHGQPSPSAMAAWDAMVEAVPFVRFGHAAANRAIVAAAPRDRRLHIVDVGIGDGIQWEEFLETLPFGRGPRRWHVKLTGIEPDAGVDTQDRLDDVGERLRCKARTRGIALYYRPVVGAVEDLDLRDYVRTGESVVVNASMSLHRVPSGDGAIGGDTRAMVLTRIRALAPRRVVLVESEAEHNQPTGGMAGRLAETLGYYLAMFDAVGCLLGVEPAVRRTLEEDYLGREMVGFCAEGPARVVRHERLARWRERFATAGFRPVALSRSLPELPRELRLPAGMDVADRNGALVVGWKASPVLAATAWACG